MSIIVAIETSTELASAALLYGGNVIARETSGVHTHSQTILPMVQSLLSEAGIGLAQCDAIAFGVGPGSFTGVRTACGIAQGLAFGADIPVVPVVTLLAMAAACRETGGAADVLTVLDARMGEVYWAQYRYENGWQTVIEPTLSLPDVVMPQGECMACGNGLAAYPHAFNGLRSVAAQVVTPHAIHIARLALDELAHGRSAAARDAQPLYLRNKVAFTTSERLARTAA